ncbi:MAG: hypothetical protein LBN22_05895 [Clostridiales Family XIII bacterium]|jgi:hypothetical protein|nr:hypothetical protein [Clostridiales Family XIII bacterium]
MFGKKKKGKHEPGANVTNTASVLTAEVDNTASEVGIPEEIIAVITAALSAYNASSGKQLIIRKINRTAGVVPAWRTASIADDMATRIR